MSAFDWSFVNFHCIHLNGALFCACFIYVAILDRYANKKSFEIKVISKPILLLVGIFFLWITGITFYISEMYAIKNNKKEDAYSAFYKELYGELNFKMAGLEAFGTYGFYVKDFYNCYIKNVDYNKELSDYLKWLKEGQTEINVNAELYGKNLIVICMETLDSFALDPFNTPNLWNLCYGNEEKTEAGNALYFDNFYSKNKTNISEDIGLLGWAPKTTILNAEYGSITYNYALPNLFNQLDYQTNYFHSYLSYYYNRNSVNRNMGFDNLYFLDDVNFEGKKEEFGFWNSELDYFNSVKDLMIPNNDSPFFSFYMTLSMHGDYESENSSFQKYDYYKIYDDNYSKFRTWFDNYTDFVYPTNPEIENNFRNYKVAAIDNDIMIGEMIKDLTEKDLLKDTTIIIYADHDCYYREISKIIKGGENDIGQKQYNVPLIIYDGSKSVIDNKINSTFTTTYNIYPTICDLFGLAYNTNMCHAVSVFDQDQSSNIMFSTETLVGYFDNNCSSTTLLNIIKANDSVTEEQVNKFIKNANQINDKQKKLTFIYESGWPSKYLLF